jgi:hypothetical protein
VQAENFGSELAQTISGDFMTATDINYAMGRLHTAVVQDRIPVRSANALAHIGHMPRSSQEPARRNRIHHSNTTQTPHSERREESLTSVAPSQLTAAESGETSTADATGQSVAGDSMIMSAGRESSSGVIPALAPIAHGASRFDGWMCAVFHSPLSR